MINIFEFGPKEKIKLTLEGEAKAIYGSYDNLPDNIKDALQILCHAALQLSDEAKKSKGGILWINKFMIAIISNEYREAFCINNFNNGMAIMNLTKKQGGYFTDFFSIKQLALADPIITAAHNDVLRNGRKE